MTHLKITLSVIAATAVAVIIGSQWLPSNQTEDVNPVLSSVSSKIEHSDVISSTLVKEKFSQALDAYKSINVAAKTIDNDSVPEQNIETVVDELKENNQPQREPVANLELLQSDQALARLELLQSDRPEVYISDQDMRLGLSQTSLWKPVDKIEAASRLANFLTEEEINDGREFITFQPYRLEVTLVGEQFELQLPNTTAASLSGEVTERTVLEGMIHWRGVFPDDNKKFHEFSFTQALGDNYVVGNVNYSGGSYSIESKDGIGWITPQENDLHKAKDFVHIDDIRTNKEL